MIKRILSFILAISLLCGIAFAAEGEAVDLSTATVEINGEFTYDGKEVDLDKVEISVVLDGKTLLQDEDFFVRGAQGSDLTSAGQHGVVIEGIGDYCGTCSAFFNIAPATVSIVEVVLEDKEYDGSVYGEVRKITVKDAKGKEFTLPESDYSATVKYDSPNAGEGKSAEVSVNERGRNITIQGKREFSFDNLTVEKGSDIVTEQMDIYYKSEVAYTVDLDAIVKSHPAYMSDDVPSFSVANKDKMFSSVEINGGKLVFALDTTKTTQNGTTAINVTVSGMANLKPLTICVFVNMAKEIYLQVDMSYVQVEDKVYDGKAMPSARSVEGKAYASGYEGTFSYYWVTSSGKTMDKSPVNAGEYGIMAKPADSKYSGEGIKYFKILQKDLVIAPKAIKIQPGEELPEFELNFDGLIDGEKITLNKTPQFKLIDKNGEQVSGENLPEGEYVILWTNADETTFTDAKNYKIQVVDKGKLTVGNPDRCTGEDCKAEAFSDVNIDLWYHQAICFALKKGIMQGISADKFAPDATLTRGQLAQILYNLEGKPETEGMRPFKDVNTNDWFCDAVTWAYEKGIVTGKTEDSFAPNENITREALCLMLYRYAGSPKVSGNLSSPDKNRVSAWAKNAIIWACNEKVINGDARGNLNPDGNATRAQVAQMFMNYLNK